MLPEPLFAFFVRRPEVWLMPPWLVALGVTVGLVLVLAVYGVVRWWRPAAAGELVALAREGVLAWVLGLAGVCAVFTLVGFAFAPWQSVFTSLAQLPRLRSEKVQQEIPAGAVDVPLGISFSLDQLQRLKLESSGRISIGTRGDDNARQENFIPLERQKPLTFVKSSGLPMFLAGIKQLVVTNASDAPVTLTIQAETGVPLPEVMTVVVALCGFLAIVLIYAVQHFLFPTIAAIAAATAREVMGQWLFWLVLAIGFSLLSPFIFPIPSLMYIPYSTFGEDIKMLKETGLTVVLVASVIVGLWSASTSIYDEIEGRTALTLLSKPVRRWQFILGKFLGIVWPVGLLLLVLGLVFLVTVSCKVVYDAREMGYGDDVRWQVCHFEMARTAPGLVLRFMEAVVLSAVSVALATRLPMLANLVISVSIYALGHLAPLIVNSSVGKFEIVRFVGQLAATVLPALDHYTIPGAVVGGHEVPLAYLGYAALYSLTYVAVALLFALALFEDRDLA